MNLYLTNITNNLLSGDFRSLSDPEVIMIISKTTIELLDKDNWDEYDQSCAGQIISMSQIVYNNTDRSILFLDDGVYDLLLEKYREYNANFQVGAPVINCDSSTQFSEDISRPLMIFIENYDEFEKNSLFYQDIAKTLPIDPNLYNQKIDRNSGKVISKKNVAIPHKYPNLVGSLDKCKFTLNKEAIDRGVFDQPNVKVFERDFLEKHLKMGLIDYDTPFEMVAELKYDGVSVEADVTDRILSARSRGDANEDMAADLSEIFEGYKFPYAPPIPENESFGMKFEAIVNDTNLERLAALKGKPYKNSRNAVIGLLGSSDAYDYRDLITLIPLATSLDGIDRITEIEFLNKYYESGEILRYAVIRGTYTEVLFKIYKFVQEAEILRNIMPFMYDGVVISYTDPTIREILGRENSINKYSMAIKFNPLVREAIFTGYSYTIGQDGIVTPMIHYTPVEFYGTIHTKSSGHSYKRFIDLNLAIGDVLHIEYTNDVMPYVTKSTNGMIKNSRPPEAFPSNCPYCNSPILINESGKSAICPNKKCSARTISRVTNMMDKLNIKDFGEETLRALNTTSISDIFRYNYDDLIILGPINAEKFLERINYIKNTPIYDYKIIGSIGFTGIAIETWKKILRNISLNEIMTDSNEVLYNKLISIKGIGIVIANTIVEERYDFMDDINAILCNVKTIIPSIGITQTGKIIRYSGCRPDDNITEYLESKGCDANPNGSVTKSTDILVVPALPYNSTKVSKLREDAILVSYSDFVSDIDRYL